MADKQAFDVEEFAEAVKRMVIASVGGGIIRPGCSSSCSCSIPHTGCIAELPAELEE